MTDDVHSGKSGELVEEASIVQNGGGVAPRFMQLDGHAKDVLESQDNSLAVSGHGNYQR